MTPQEQELVKELFDRLAQLESNPRDPSAERLIADGLRDAPHAIYALVQTALVQDEALKRAPLRLRPIVRVPVWHRGWARPLVRADRFSARPHRRQRA